MLVIGILGNKSDLIDKEEVDESEAREYAKSINAVYGRTSAFSGSGIKDTFKEIIKKFAEYVEKNNITDDIHLNSVVIKKSDVQDNNKKKNCISKLKDFCG